MKFFLSMAKVLGGIFVGINLLNYFVLGNTADYLPASARMGEWKKAEIREVCYPALEHPERDPLMPKLSTDQHRIDWRDLNRSIEMTAALNCYLVTHVDAVCEPNNRAYIVDYINRYFAKIEEMLDGAKRYGEAEIKNVKNLWDSPRNRAINAALVRDINDGRLIKADFGWTTPKQLKAMLEQHKSAANTCPRA